MSKILVMNSYEIAKNVNKLFQNYNYSLNNAYVFRWECDFFAISKSNYSIEVEIKISKSDFKADFNKMASSKELKHDYLINVNEHDKPNKFFFAFPKGMIEHNEVPEMYGIIEVYNNCAEITRNAKFLHKMNLLNSSRFLMRLLNKFYYRNIDLRNALRLRDYDIAYRQETLNI